MSDKLSRNKESNKLYTRLSDKIIKIQSYPEDPKIREAKKDTTQEKEMEKQLGEEIKSLRRELSNLKILMEEYLLKQVVNNTIKEDGQPKQQPFGQYRFNYQQPMNQHPRDQYINDIQGYQYPGPRPIDQYNGDQHNNGPNNDYHDKLSNNIHYNPLTGLIGPHHEINLKKPINVNQNSTMETGVPKKSQKGFFGGQVAIKHPKESQVGIQSNPSKNIRNKKDSIHFSNRTPEPIPNRNPRFIS